MDLQELGSQAINIRDQLKSLMSLGKTISNPVNSKERICFNDNARNLVLLGNREPMKNSPKLGLDNGKGPQFSSEAANRRASVISQDATTRSLINVTTIGAITIKLNPINIRRLPGNPRRVRINMQAGSDFTEVQSNFY
ncbi:DNA topoisomerase IV subunit A [Sesbania bispinosa]|nr:DNA topoisomerase IV subunit A [Sesbania bispinosa]